MSLPISDNLKYKYKVINGIRYAWEYVPSSKLYFQSVFITGIFAKEININKLTIVRNGLYVFGKFMFIRGYL